MLSDVIFDALEGLVEGRVYPLKLPDDVTYPAITYRRTRTSQDYTHDGPGMITSQIQFSLRDNSYVSAKQLAKSVSERIHDLSGIYDGIYIDYIDLVGEVDIYEDETGKYFVPIDFVLVYQNEEA